MIDIDQTWNGKFSSQIVRKNGGCLQMKREDVDSEGEENDEKAEEEQPRLERSPGAKRRKEKMTVAELRQSYREKIAPGIRTMDRNVLNQMWNTTIVHAKWTFKDTLDIITSLNETQGDIVIAVMLSEYLASNNFPWKHWFFMEFGDVVRDLRMEQNDPKIPYPWLALAFKRNLKKPELQHDDDALFVNVPWRSCYMWTAMFRRRCAKYYAEFHLRYRQRNRKNYTRTFDDPEEMTNFKAMRDSVFIEEAFDGIATVYYVDKWGRKSVVHNIDEEFADTGHVTRGASHFRNTYGIVARTWMMWQFTHYGLKQTDAPEFFDNAGNKRILIQPNVGKDRAHVTAGEFQYNFTPQVVECFLRWYMNRMATVGTIPPSIGDWTFADKDEFGLAEELYDIRERPFPRQRDIRRVMDTSVDLGFLVRHKQPPTGDKYILKWPLLKRLPLCPRRITKADPEKRAVQFLGARDLGE